MREVQRRKENRAQVEAEKASKRKSKIKQLARNYRDVKQRMVDAGDKYKPTVADLKVLVGFKKKEGDGAMLKAPKKKDWLDRYHRTKGRPTPNVSLAESEGDVACEGDNVSITVRSRRFDLGVYQ